MSDAKMISEREAVLREREAFLRGAQHHNEKCAELCVTQVYPLPKVKRPRVVEAEREETWLRAEFRVADGVMEWRFVGSRAPWKSFGAAGLPLTPARARAAVDVLANPTEEVDV